MKKLFLLLLLSGTCSAEESKFRLVEDDDPYASVNFQVIEMDEPVQEISFLKDDKPVGKIIWRDGILVFEGQVDDSARIFFRYMFEKFIKPGCVDMPN